MHCCARILREGGGKKIRPYSFSPKMLLVFHAVKQLIDSICMDLQSPFDKVIRIQNRIIIIENRMKITPRIKNEMIVPTLSSCVISSACLAMTKRVFFLHCRAAPILYLRIQGCRPNHPPSQHPALIHFQQILHRHMCFWTSWGFVTVPGWERIRWTTRGVCIFKPKGFRYQSKCFLRQTAATSATDMGAIAWPFSVELPLGDVTYMNRFEVVSELNNFISLTAGRVIDPPTPGNHSASIMGKDIFIYQIRQSSFSDGWNLIWTRSRCTTITQWSLWSLLTIPEHRHNRAQCECASQCWLSISLIQICQFRRRRKRHTDRHTPQRAQVPRMNLKS